MSAPAAAPTPRATGADGQPAPTLRRMGIASFPPPIAANPYQRLLYAQLEEHGFRQQRIDRLSVRRLWGARRQVGRLHFHWPQTYYHDRRLRGLTSWPRLWLFVVRLGAARALGYRICWTIHQVYPHESPSKRLDQLAGRALASASDVLIAHDRATVETARRELGLSRTIEVIPHPAYTGTYAPGHPRAVVRRSLGVPEAAFALLCFGHVRQYKGLVVLTEAFSAVTAADVVLVIAGLPVDKDAAAAVRAAAQRDRRIVPLLEFVPEDRVAELHAAVDAAVVARSDGGTSGALALALTLGLPVVAADAYRVQVGAAGWFFRPGDAQSLRGAIERAVADPDFVTRRAAAGNPSAPSWNEVGSRTARLFCGDGT